MLMVIVGVIVGLLVWVGSGVVVGPVVCWSFRMTFFTV